MSEEIATSGGFPDRLVLVAAHKDDLDLLAVDVDFVVEVLQDLQEFGAGAAPASGKEQKNELGALSLDRDVALLDRILRLPLLVGQVRLLLQEGLTEDVDNVSLGQRRNGRFNLISVCEFRLHCLIE